MNFPKAIRFLGFLVVISAFILNPITVGKVLSVDSRITGVGMFFAIVFVDMIIILIGLFLIIRPRLIYRKRKEISIMILSFLLCIFIFELSLNLLGCTAKKEHFFGDVQFKFIPEMTHCFELKDGPRFYRESNSEGFLDDAFSSNDSEVVFLLGDSFAECFHVNYSDCMHVKLEESLKEKDERIEVYNFGVGGYGTRDQLAILKHYSSIYHPKKVILLFQAQNDIIDNIRYEKYGSGKSRFFLDKILKIRTVDFFIQKASMLGDRVLNKGMEKKYRNQHITNYEIYVEDYDDTWKGRWDDELRYIEEIKNLSESNDAKFLLVSATSVEQVYDEDWDRLKDTYPELKDYSYETDKPNRILMNFSEDIDIDYLDLLPYFRNSTERLHWEYDGHWNTRGNVLAAEIISKKLG